MKPTFYTRYALLILACFLFTTPWVITSARRAVEQNSNRVSDWLPESFDATQRLRWFQKHFAADDLLVISWEGCTFDDPRLPQLAEKLRQPVAVGHQRQVVFQRQVITGPEALARLRRPPLELSRQAAQLRLQGWVVGKDLQHTCLVYLITKEGWKYRDLLVQHIRDCADQVEGLSSHALRMAGSIIDSVTIDQASQKNLRVMMTCSFAIGCLLLGLLFRSWVLMGMVFLTAFYCQQLSLSLVYSTGGHMDSVMLMIPSLIYVLTISAGVHLAHYYLDAVSEGGISGAAERAVHKALLPCGLAATTTTMGLGSLTISFLNPVSNFGAYAALGVLVTTLCVFLLFPALLTTLPSASRAVSSHTHAPWSRTQSFVTRYANLILCVAALGLGAGLWGVFHFRSSARVHDFFAAEAPIIQDYDWLEERIGPLVPLEVVLRFPIDYKTAGYSLLDRLRVVGATHGALAETPGVGAVVSPLNFAPRIPRRGTNAWDVSREALLNQQLEKNLTNFRDMGFYRELEQEQLWRISARAYAGHGLEYADLLQELRAAVDPILLRNQQRGLGAIAAVYCGGVPLVQQAQEQMLLDLAHSFSLAFGLIAIMMIGLQLVGARAEFAAARGWTETTVLVLRRTAAGLLAMIPNILPCVLVLGGMGLAGLKLEVGSLMTASVALGIAVDDTLHFITWFRRGLQRGDSRPQAVRYAYVRCAAAMTLTTLVCGLGLLSFAWSEFIPIARFAWVMFAMLVSALVADLLVLPALLLSRLGAIFEPARRLDNPVAPLPGEGEGPCDVKKGS